MAEDVQVLERVLKQEHQVAVGRPLVVRPAGLSTTLPDGKTVTVNPGTRPESVPMISEWLGAAVDLASKLLDLIPDDWLDDDGDGGGGNGGGGSGGGGDVTIVVNGNGDVTVNM